MTTSSSEIPREAFRGVVFEALRRDAHQWLALKGSVAAVAAERGFVPAPTGSGQPRLGPRDEAGLRTFVWQLIAQGVMTVGLSESNDAWPFLSVTDLGRSVLEGPEVSILPYDHLGYIEELRTRDPNVPEVVLEAIGEAAECFSTGTHRAATVMLGVASEATLRQLISAIASSIEDEGRRKEFQAGHIRPHRPRLLGR